MDWIADPQAWIGLLTLTVLEVVLGIDNIIFISILSSKLPRDTQARARRLGLMGAFVSRLLLLLSIAWIVRLTTPLFSVAGLDLSGRSLILLLGGLFLIAKATYEIHDKLEGEEHAPRGGAAGSSLAAVVSQIMVVDIIFSLDSVITAVGMVTHIPVMIAANVIALGVMLMAATPIAEFVDRHPTVKLLALAFLVLIGTNLVAEGTGVHIPKGYTYFAMAFAFLVEMLNLRLRGRAAQPVVLHDVPRLKRSTPQASSTAQPRQETASTARPPRPPRPPRAQRSKAPGETETSGTTRASGASGASGATGAPGATEAAGDASDGTAGTGRRRRRRKRRR